MTAAVSGAALVMAVAGAGDPVPAPAPVLGVLGVGALAAWAGVAGRGVEGAAPPPTTAAVWGTGAPKAMVNVT